ncbi:MAG: hypothetical protein WCP46_07695 [Alphaproteobacteria bacterium]
MRIFIILLLLNFYSFGYTAEVADVAMVDAEIASPRTPDQGDRKQRLVLNVSDNSQPTAPAECSIEKAEALAEWFCKSHLGNWGGSFYSLYYNIEYKKIQNDTLYVLYLRPTDPEVSCQHAGRPATTFKIVAVDTLPKDMWQLLYDLQTRYLKQDMVSQMTDAAFQRAGIFPGLTFFNRVAQTRTREEQSHLDKSRKLLPSPYDTEFVKPTMPSDIRPYSFFRAVSLYQTMSQSEISSYWLSYLSTAIRDLQPFYSADAADSEITEKHGVFIKSLLDNLFYNNKLKIESVFVTQLIGLYRSAVTRLGDFGIDLLDSVQGSIAASLINLTNVNNEGMNVFLARFKDYLNERNSLIEQLR